MNDSGNEKSTGHATTSSDEASANDSVEKIRDILFGGNMRDYERRFAQLEQRIVSENRRLADDLLARFEQLDAFMRQEFKAQTERLAGERAERVRKAEEQATALHESRKALEEKIADVDDSLMVAAQEIRSRLHEQGSELLEIVRKGKEELNRDLHERAERLTTDKVARTDLADLLTEMALRLKREFELPNRQDD